MNAPPKGIDTHKHALVFVIQSPRELQSGEPGEAWLKGAGAHRSALRATEIAVVLAQYIRLLGYEASAHSPSTSDADLNRLAVAAGLATVEDGVLSNPYLGTGFSMAAITTDFEIAHGF